MDHTVHLVDIMRWYLGSEVREVYAQSNKIFHAGEVEVETGGLELITFKTASLPPSTPAGAVRLLAHLGWAGLRAGHGRGAVVVDAFKQNLTIYSHAERRPVWSYWGSDANQAMIENS
jgi:predicted dehydrogenase